MFSDNVLSGVLLCQYQEQQEQSKMEEALSHAPIAIWTFHLGPLLHVYIIFSSMHHNAQKTPDNARCTVHINERNASIYQVVDIIARNQHYI